MNLTKLRIKEQHSETASIQIRRANFGDIQDLFQINRESFPESLRCKAPLCYWKKRWSSLITARSSEVYVGTVNGKVAFFAIMVIDPVILRKELEKNHVPFIVFAHSFAVLLYRVCISPKIILSLIRKALLKIIFKIVFILKENRPENKENSYPSNPTWIRLIAVCSKYRKKGLGSLMLDFLEQRSVELDRQVIGVHVEKNNSPAISLYKSRGYIRTRRTSDGFAYKKLLNP